MGADMLVAHLEYPADKEWEDLEWASGEKVINELAKLPLKDWPKAYLHEGCGDLSDDEVENDSDGKKRDEAVAQLRSDLEALKSYTRELAEFKVGSTMVVVTGGMSWGDSPTDAYYYFWRLIAAGVTEAVGFK